MGENIKEKVSKGPTNVELVQKNAYRPGTLYCRFKFSWSSVQFREADAILLASKAKINIF